MTMNVYRFKVLLEQYGNVLVLKKFYDDGTIGIKEYAEKIGAKVSELQGKEKYYVVTCPHYYMSDEEREELKKINAYQQIQKSIDLAGIKPETPDNAAEMRKELLKKRNEQVLKELAKREKTMSKLKDKTDSGTGE